MTTERIHRAVTPDGAEIAGRVHGTGPPIVFVPGAFQDGEHTWDPLLPHVTDRYTVIAMSTRGRGLSGDHDDHALGRLVDDVVAVAESVGEPVGLFGWSLGGALALGAAQTTAAVTAVAAHEPAVVDLIRTELGSDVMDAVGRAAEAATSGQLPDAVRTFYDVVTNDEEFADAAATGLFDALAPNVPVQLHEIQLDAGSDDPSLTDPAALATVEVPVLLTQGTRSEPDPLFYEGTRHVAAHVRDARVRTLDGVGHFAPRSQPEAVAAELVDFFGETLRAA